MILNKTVKFLFARINWLSGLYVLSNSYSSPLVITFPLFVTRCFIECINLSPRAFSVLLKQVFLSTPKHDTGVLHDAFSSLLCSACRQTTDMNSGSLLLTRTLRVDVHVRSIDRPSAKQGKQESCLLVDTSIVAICVTSISVDATFVSRKLCENRRSRKNLGFASAAR